MTTMKTLKTDHFTFEEFVYSDTAKKFKIDNTPKDECIIENIVKLMNFLEDFRQYYGSPIRISSGYRCEKLNKKVGGVKNSAHLKGYAADIQPINNDFEDFARKMYYFIDINNIDFDQCIFEKSKTSKWIHISIDPKCRKQIFKLNA